MSRRPQNKNYQNECQYINPRAKTTVMLALHISLGLTITSPEIITELRHKHIILHIITYTSVFAITARITMRYNLGK